MIGSKNSRHFLSQSQVKPKPIVTRLRTISRAPRQLHVSASSIDWITGLFVTLFGWKCDNYGFGRTALS